MINCSLKACRTFIYNKFMYKTDGFAKFKTSKKLHIRRSK